jgi:hypothetical protein
LWVQAAGFVATQTELELPHRGEWTSFEVKLESLRDRALAPFRRLALKALPSPRTWGVWTSRETREWLIKRAPHQQAALGQLTADVERACYAEETPSETDVAEIERTIANIEADGAGGNVNESASETRAVR